MILKEARYLKNGKEYTVNIKRRHTRYTRYYFRNGEFVVSAPLTQKEADIFKGLDKFFDQLVTNNPFNSSRSENHIYLLGIEHELIDNTLYIDENTLIKYKDIEDLDKKLKKWFLPIITERTRYYEQIMNTCSNQVKLRKMITRYGCNNMRKHVITFSNIMMHYSIDIINSVVVHELSHCFEGNHSIKFYNIVYQYCPNYKYLHKKLRKGEFQ